MREQFVAHLDALGRDALSAWVKANSNLLTDSELILLKGEDALISSAISLGLTMSGFPQPNEDSATPQTIEHWLWFASNSDNPLLAARAARNLWLTKYDDLPFRFAKEAITSFAAIGESENAAALARSEAIGEAISLAADTSQIVELASLVELANRLLKEMATQSVGHDPASFDKYQEGLVLGPEGSRDLTEALAEDVEVLQERRFHDAQLDLIRSLASLVGGKYKELIDRPELLAQAWRFASDVDQSDILARAIEPTLVALSEPGSERSRVRRWWIEREVARADARSDSSRWAILAQMEQLARDENLQDLVGVIRLRMQNFDVEELTQKITTEFEIPAAVLDHSASLVDAICDHELVGDALDEFVVRGINFSKADKTADFASTSFMDRFDGFTISVDGAAQRVVPGTGQDEEESPLVAEIRRAEHYTGSVQFEASLVAVPAWRRICEKFSDQLENELLDRSNGSGFLDEVRSRRAVDAVLLTCKGEWDTSSHVLVPRLEFAIRQAAKRFGAPVISSAVGSTRGGHVSLNKVLANLKGIAPEPERQHLEWILTSDLSANLRNDISHGDRPEIEEKWAVVLIHGYLLTLSRLHPRGD